MHDWEMQSTKDPRLTATPESHDLIVHATTPPRVRLKLCCTCTPRSLKSTHSSIVDPTVPLGFTSRLNC